MAESDSTGTITAVYTYGPGGPVSLTRGGDTYFYQTNAHGDVVSLTDSTGAVVNTYSYDPWGKVLSASETVANPLRYAGYYYDSSTGLYYLLNRYYDPGLKRFLTIDPAGAPKARTAALNPYAYCENNPLGFVDPSGLAAETASDWLDFAYTATTYGMADPKERDKMKLDLGISIIGLATPGVDSAACKSLGRFLSKADLINALEKSTGQVHHVVPRKVTRYIENNCPNLKGQISRNDPRYMTRAKDKLSHWGYQKWHRDLDKDILAWLDGRTDVTLIEFHAYLKSLYSEGELLKKFPNGLPGL